MKKNLHLLIVILLLSCQNTFSTGTWYLESYRCNAIQFVNSNIGFAINDGGCVRKTTDGGQTWALLNTEVTTNLYTINFINNSVGFIGGEYGTLIKTSDGGGSWTLITTPVTTEIIVSVKFKNTTVGYFLTDNGTIYKTSNGGTTWSAGIETGASYSYTDELGNLSVFNDTIYATAPGGGVYKSYDGGSNWDYNNLSYADQTYFVTSKIGYAINNNQKMISKTTDGGNNWQTLNNPSVTGLYEVHFADANNGYVACGGGEILKTSDGGNTWNLISTGRTEDLFAIYCKSSSNVFIGGNESVLLSTSNAGATWSLINTTPSGNADGYNAVAFIDSNNVIAVGGSGTILKSIDKGTTWKRKTSPTTTGLNGLHFVNNLLGFAVGYSGVIIKTTDGGETWVNLTSGTLASFNCVYFLNASRGYAGGTAGYLYQTLDGGVTWTRIINSSINDDIKSIVFKDANNGYLVGFDDLYAYTTDQGNTWQVPFVGPIGNHDDVFFVNQTVGYIAGSGFHKTIDGGTTWTQLSTSYDMKAIYFKDALNGYAVENSISILKTTDGGVTWTYEDRDLFSSTMFDVTFSGENGIVTGAGGIIFRNSNYNLADNSGSSSVKKINFVPNQLVEINPNPASNYINVKLKSNANAPSNFELMNATGIKMVDKDLCFGNSTIDLQDLPSGIYVFKIISDGAIITQGKLVISR